MVNLLRTVLTTALELAGAVALVYGIALVCVPAAYIVAGAAAIALGELL